MSEVSSARALGLVARGIYPERKVAPPHWTERIAQRAIAIAVSNVAAFRLRRLQRIVPVVNRIAEEFAELDDAALLREARRLRPRLRGKGLDDPGLVARSFALVREVTDRRLGMRHFNVQLVGAYALLQGTVAEMATGEGKTLTAAMAASTAALSGVPVHVVTVNDYLARRDVEALQPVFEALGLTVGCVVHGQTPDERRAAYRCDITYATNKELAFDYLRDRITTGGHSGRLRLLAQRLAGPESPESRLLLRGLHFAIVDEADSIFVDEARTPLIISGPAEPDERTTMGPVALEVSAQLEQGRDFVLDQGKHRAHLTRVGSLRVHELTHACDGLWHNEVLREEVVCQALAARHLFHEGQAYIVRNGKLEIVDEFTGRVIEGRSWSEGLHQLIELKEGLERTQPRVPIARITYQRFFRRYRRLSGMTGTASDIARELWSVFRLCVTRIPTNRPTRRRYLADQVYPDAEAKWDAIARRCAELHKLRKPVLLGTRSVAASEAASERLTAFGIPHRVLNAAQDRHEAEIIAEAGVAGGVTIATNMAGRGTDIVLGEGVAELGGLHVIMSERHEAGRIDRQLAGRCARQGAPGTFEAILALDDPLLDNLRIPKWTLRPGGQWASRRLFRSAQKRAERKNARIRMKLLKQDEKLGTLLAFTGKLE